MQISRNVDVKAFGVGTAKRLEDLWHEVSLYIHGMLVQMKQGCEWCTMCFHKSR